MCECLNNHFVHTDRNKKSGKTQLWKCDGFRKWLERPRLELEQRDGEVWHQLWRVTSCGWDD